MKTVNPSSRRKLSLITATAASLLAHLSGYAQDGNEGIDQATEMVKSYFDSGANLMYAIGALLGLIGGVKV